MIKVEVANVVLVNMGKEYIILLKSSIDSRTLPISVGQLEAQSIAIQINDIPFPRPLTHDLFKTVLSESHFKLKHVIIRDLADETFYADMVLENNGKQVVLDCRPSDAIAIALRCATPLFVEDKVMDEAGIILPEQDLPESFAENKTVSITEDDTQLSPLELLNKKLNTAVNEERYEDAAKFRDEIERLSNSN